MKRIALALTIIAPALLHAQATDWTDAGHIDSREVKLERRGASGVIGTEFVHYEYRVTWKIVSTDDKKPKGLWVWQNTCKGKKHKDHKDCDLSCDEKAKNKEHIVLRGEAEEYKDSQRAMERESANQARAIQMPGGPDNWSSATTNALRNALRDARNKKLEFDVGPVNVPCTDVTHKYGLRKFEFHVHGEFWKVGYYMSGGVRSNINEKVSEQDGVVAGLWYPEKDPIKVEEFPNCKCNAIAEPPKKPIDEIIDEWLQWIDDITAFEESMREFNRIINELTIQFFGDSMNETRCQITNKSGKDQTVIIPPGTMLRPESGDTQIMAIRGMQRLKVPANSTQVFYLNSDPNWEDLGPLEKMLKIACTELKKHAPTTSTKFKVMPNPDMNLRRIMAFEEPQSALSGLNAQGRTWIYTDKATLDEINERLRPGMTEGMYANALATLAKENGIDMLDAKFKRCFDAKLIMGSSARMQTTAWLIPILADYDESGLGKALNAYLGELPTRTHDRFANIEIAHAVNLCEALANVGKPASDEMALKILRAIPTDVRAKFIELGGADAFRALLYSTPPKASTATLEIVGQWSLPELKPLVEAMVNFNSNETLRTAAEAILKKMG